MIRKKKTDKDVYAIDDNASTEDLLEDLTVDETEKRPFWKKKASKDVSDPEMSDIASDIEEKNDFDPDFEEEDVEYISDEKKISKKKIFLIAGIAIVCVAGIIAMIAKNLHGGEEGKVYVQSVEVLAGLGSANGATNRYTGEVEAQDSWKITLEQDMSVEKCYVKVGDTVRKGDKLFIYNTEELTLNKEKKELELDTMNNEIRQLTKDIATYESDMKNAQTREKIELQTQILTAQTTIKKDEFNIKSCKEEIEKIEKNIKDATVFSKMDGVIKSINENIGESSNGNEDAEFGGNSEEASAYMTVLATGDYRVKGKISETNMSSISEGIPVIIRSRTDDNVWQGSIESIKTDETTDENNENNAYNDGTQNASTYYFYVALADDEGLLMGQHVFVEPDHGQDEDREGLWISSAFVFVEEQDVDQEDLYYVWADNGHGRLEKRAVEIGNYDDLLDEYQILSGITAEDYIACDDIDLKAGMKTTKTEPMEEENYNDGSDGEEMIEDGMDNQDQEYYDDANGQESFDDESFESYSDEELEEMTDDVLIEEEQ